MLYGLVKKKVLKSHKRVRLDTFVDATPRHARGGQEDDNGASTCRNKQNPLPPPPADLDHLAAASRTQWSPWERDHTQGRGELLEEEEQAYMHVCVCVCVCVCVYTCICVCVYKYTCVCVCVCVC